MHYCSKLPDVTRVPIFRFFKVNIEWLLDVQIRHGNYLEVSPELKEHAENVFGCISRVKIIILRQENQLFHEEKIHVFHSILKFSKNLLLTSKIIGRAKGRVGGLLGFQIRHDSHLEVSLRFKEHDENVFGCIASVKIKISRQENQLFHEEKIHIFH